MGVLEKPSHRTQQPRLYQVLLHNDDFTTMEFVVSILMAVFHYPEEKAIEIMLKVHHQGIGIAGIYSHEIAETKIQKVHILARENEYPLLCTLEPV